MQVLFVNAELMEGIRLESGVLIFWGSVVMPCNYRFGELAIILREDYWRAALGDLENVTAIIRS